MDQTSSPNERPREARQPTREVASVATGGMRPDNPSVAVVVDVSSTGLRFRTPQPPRKHRMATLRIDVDGAITEVRGRVVRVEATEGAQYDVGVEFDPKAVDGNRFLDRILRRPVVTVD